MPINLPAPRGLPGEPRVGRPFGLRLHLLALALALLVPTLALGAAIAWKAVGAYRHDFETRLQDTARALALALDREFGVFEATLTGLAAGRLLDEDATPADFAEFHERARQVAEPLGSWVVVSGPGPDFPTQVHTQVAPGAPLPPSPASLWPDSARRRAFSTGRPAIGNINASLLNGQQAAFVFVPVIRGGRVVRAAGMAVDPARLARVLEQAGLSGGAFAVATDAGGVIAARSLDHAGFLGRLAPQWYRDAVAGQDGTLLRGASLGGAEVVLGFARIAAAPGWTVAVTESWAAYAASWQNPLWALALGGGVAVVLGMVLALDLAKRLLRPLRAMARDAASFADGSGESLRRTSAPPSRITEFEALRIGLAAADTALRARAAAKHAADERQALLMREVDHRAKNALAVALSLVRLAPRDVPPARFAAAVEGRIAAMTRAHSLLARESWGGASLRAVAEGELAAHAGRVRIAGPAAQLAAEAVQPMAMLLHELATNAAKHGALSAPGGTVDLAWDFVPKTGGLRLSWVESGGPPVPGAPERRGFGSRLIAQLAERQLRGRIGIDWRAAGLRISLVLPPGHATPRPDTAATVPGAAMRDGGEGKPARLAVQGNAARGAAGGDARPPRVLVVEDQALLSLEVEAALHEMGCEVVGPARSLSEALALAMGEADLHAAVLDVNLGGDDRSFPVADLLETRGVPYLFVTGYESVAALAGRDIGAVTVLQKPYAREVLAEAIGRALRHQPVAG